MKTVAVAGAKGGIGKTSVSVHLATGLAKQGKRVLLVDLDSQANATAWLAGSPPADARGAAEALTTGAIAAGSLLEVPAYPGLSVLPATPALSKVDIALAGEAGGHVLFGEALDGVAGSFDAAILDCPPSLGLTVLSALCASDGIVAPVTPAFMTLAGLRRLEELLERIRTRLRVPVEMLGYLLFAVDRREAISAEARELLRSSVGPRLFSAEVRVSTAAKVLPAHQRTAWESGADPRGAEDYAAVLAEVTQRLERRKAA